MKPEELYAVIATRLGESEDTREVHLDRVGEALGLAAASADDVDRVLGRLEAAGRRIVAPDGGDGESKLATVLATARDLRTKLGRTPRAAEIAAAAGISEDDVRHALGLARVMGR